MSYSQFSYNYPTSSQILVSSSPVSVSPCCPASDGGGGSGGDSRSLLSPFPRLAPTAAGFGLYGYAAADPHLTATLSGTSPSAFYPSLPSPYDLKESRTSWSALQPTPGTACYPYDPSGLASCGPYGDRYGTIDSVARRKNATRETTNTLKAWLYEHRKNPYPTKGEKIMLAIITKMTLTQVSTWFANARRRLKKENKMTWEPRNKTSEGDDRDSSSPRDKSDDNTNEEDSNLTPAIPTIDYLKQESEVFANKNNYQDFDDPTLDSKSISKNCVAYGVNCYKPQPSEDSGAPGSPSSPARPQQVSCYQDRSSTRYELNKNELQQQKDSVYCSETAGSFGSRPKIWSLARTATSNSPPLIRRYQGPADFCLEKDCESDCVKSKTEYSCAVTPYSDYDRTSAIATAATTGKDVPGVVVDLCCDRPVAFGNMMPSCSVAAKCETAHCLSPAERNSCMVNVKSQCNYATDYSNSGSEHYARFKNKDLCAIEYATTKCQALDNTGDEPVSKKLASPAILPYTGPNPGTANEFYSTGSGFDSDHRLLQHKSSSG